MIHIHLDSQGAIRSLAHVAQSLNQGKPLFAMLGEALMTIHKHRFEQEQKSPTGEAWKPLSPAYRAKKRKNQGKILILDRHLKNTLRYQANHQQVLFGSDRPYARLHQFGSPKASGRGSGVPARPWLGLSHSNKDYLLAKTEHFLQQVLNAR